MQNQCRIGEVELELLPVKLRFGFSAKLSYFALWFVAVELLIPVCVIGLIQIFHEKFVLGLALFCGGLLLSSPYFYMVIFWFRPVVFAEVLVDSEKIIVHNNKVSKTFYFSEINSLTLVPFRKFGGWYRLTSTSGEKVLLSFALIHGEQLFERFAKSPSKIVAMEEIERFRKTSVWSQSLYKHLLNKL